MLPVFSPRRLLPALLFFLLLAAGAALEGAPLYSIGQPSAEEQLYLELINRARANPTAEGVLLAATGDPAIEAAIAAFGVDLSLYKTQMAVLPPAPPLAFNSRLIASARAHATDMFTHAFQDHIGSDGSTPGTRISAQGYVWAAYGENIFSYARSVLYGHAAFEIDWGGAASEGGMQNPPAHRETIHNPLYREIGVGVVDGTNGGVGPQVVTQDFALAQGVTPALLTGVIYADGNGNGFYDLGEGIAGVNVNVAGAEYSAVSASSGGYALPLPNDGSYSVTFSGGGLPTLQKTVLVTGGQNVKLDYAFAGTLPSALANISTRAKIGSGDDALIGGFIVSGAATKTILIRGLGPSLGVNGQPLAGALQDPTLELHDGNGALLASNDDWQSNANAAAIAESTVAPADPREPALLVSLEGNNRSYTAIVRGKNGAGGISLVEIYDLARSVDSKLTNISTRGAVASGDEVMIGGFILGGSTSAPVLLRALGPTLPVSAPLSDPTLELVDGNGTTLQTNDDWRSTDASAILATGLAPQNEAEAAIIATLAPGAYTAIVRSAKNTSGLALFEAYLLP